MNTRSVKYGCEALTINQQDTKASQLVSFNNREKENKHVLYKGQRKDQGQEILGNCGMKNIDIS